MKNHPRPRITTIAYHVALWPVVLGVAIVLGWYFYRFSWLPIAGMYLLCFAVPNLIVAVVLVVKWIKNSRLPQEVRVNSRLFSFPFLALLTNYFVGILCMMAGISIGNRADILIINNSSYSLEAIQAQDPIGTETAFPNIEPNDRASISLYPQGEGPLKVRFTANGKKVVTTPIGYLAWGSDNTATLVVDKDLGHSVGREGELQVFDSSLLND